MSTILDSPVGAETANPFKFLDYYTDSERDHAMFAGRDADTREVVAGILRHPCFVLFGRSGLGKTSLLLAGVFPELRDCQYCPIHIRLLQDTMGDLAAAVRTSLGLSSDESSPEVTTEWLRSAAKRGPVVLVFDQFEEFFTRFRGQPEQQRRFTEYIAGLLRMQAFTVHVVFSLREDYLAELDDFRADLPDVLAHGWRLRPLTSFGVRQTIVRVLVKAGVDYEQKLLSGLVDLIATYGGLEPTVLQIVRYEVFDNAMRRAERPLRLTEHDLEQVGGLDGIYRRYLKDVIKQIDPSTVLLARALLDALITSENTKRAVTMEDLLSAGFEASPEEVRRTLDRLVATRIVRPDRRNEILWYELAHERLVPPLLEWFSADEWYSNFRRVQSLIADNCRGQLWRDNVDLLLSEGVLELAGRYHDRLRLDALEMEFMLWSAVYRKSDALTHWASACGHDVTTRTLTKLLDKESPNSRNAGATAAFALKEMTPEIRSRLRALALSDSDANVRRAAGRALVRPLDADDVAAIRSALQERNTKEAAIEVLSDAYDAGASVPIGQSRTALVALWSARRRLWKRYRDQIAERVRNGTRTACLAAASWMSTVGLCASALLTWALEGAAVAVYAGILSGVGIGSATLLGWWATKRAARGVVQGQLSWFRPIFVSTVPIVLVVFVVTAIVTGIGEAAAGTVVTAVIVVLLAGLTAYARPVLVSTREPQEQWAHAATIQFGLPIGGACVVNLAAIAILRRQTAFPAEGARLLIISVFAVALILSLGSFVLSMAFARAFENIKMPDPPDRTVRSRLKIARFVAVMSVVALVGSYSGNSVLPLIDPIEMTAGKVEQNVTVGPGWPDATYLKFDVPTSGWRKLALPNSAQAETRIDGSVIATDNEAAYFSYVTAGPHRVSFNNRYSWRGFGVQIAFGAETIPTLIDGPLKLDGGGRKIVQFPLKQTPTSMWEGLAHIKLDSNSVPNGNFDQAALRAILVGDIDIREFTLNRFRPQTQIEQFTRLYRESRNLSISREVDASPEQRPFRSAKFVSTLSLELKPPLVVDQDWYLPIAADGTTTVKAVVSAPTNSRFHDGDPPLPLVLALDVVSASDVALAIKRDQAEHAKRADSTIKSIESGRRD